MIIWWKDLHWRLLWFFNSINVGDCTGDFFSQKLCWTTKKKKKHLCVTKVIWLKSGQMAYWCTLEGKPYLISCSSAFFFDKLTSQNVWELIQWKEAECEYNNLSFGPKLFNRNWLIMKETYNFSWNITNIDNCLFFDEELYFCL